MACCGSPTGFSDKTPTSVPLGQKWGFARYSLHIPSLLQEMKAEEFDAMVQEWIAALPELTVNEKTVEEFSPEVIGKRQNG